jgi:hypothetical protein
VIFPELLSKMTLIPSLLKFSIVPAKTTGKEFGSTSKIMFATVFEVPAKGTQFSNVNVLKRSLSGLSGHLTQQNCEE